MVIGTCLSPVGILAGHKNSSAVTRLAIWRSAWAINTWQPVNRDSLKCLPPSAAGPAKSGRCRCAIRRK